MKTKYTGTGLIKEYKRRFLTETTVPPCFNCDQPSDYYDSFIEENLCEQCLANFFKAGKSEIAMRLKVQDEN